MKCLLDTNFLMIPGKFKVDIFSELAKFGKPELFTLDSVLGELEKIARGKGKNSVYARLGLQILREKKAKILKSCGRVTDREIIRLAEEEGYSVCTQDKGIIKKLRGKAGIITMRQKKYLIEV